MTSHFKKTLFALTMIIVGAGATVAYFLAERAATPWRPTLGPTCLGDEKRTGGIYASYCGDLHSLAAINVREVELEQVLADLDYPWAFEFIDEETILVTEFAGKLKRIEVKTGGVTEISGIPRVAVDRGQVGLLDVALHPDFATNSTVYLSYVAEDADELFATTVLKAELRDDQLANVETIVAASPPGDKTSNFGGALLFDNEGYLYVTLGDQSTRKLAQDPSALKGKILRLNDDGSIPDSNPFVDSKDGIHPAIYALGVRNPQGLVQDSATGIIYEAEHGPMGGDEVNVIEAGKNYGWPDITYGMDYTYISNGKGTQQEGMEQPLYYYLPSLAISPIEIYRGDMFSEWDGDLLVGALKGFSVSKLDVVDGQVKSEFQILGEINGRIRDVKVAKDGAIWVLAENGGRLYRLSRTEKPDSQLASIGHHEGKEIYSTFCQGCHSQNTPGVPQIENRHDWTDRLEKGRKELYKNTINGINGMPEKGFCDDCSKKELKSAVNYMLDQIGE